MLKLSPKNEKLLLTNKRELSMVEGNILGVQQGIQTLFVTSCFNGEGKTRSSVSLAYGLTQSGSARVLLVDGNTRSPELHNMFNTEIQPGFREFLFSASPMDQMFHETAYTNLFFMPCGAAARIGTERDAAGQLKERLNELSNLFDFIVFDGNSIYDSSDSALLSKNFDGILLTVECEKTKWDVVRQTVDKINKFEGNVIGIILNKRKYYLPRFVYKFI